MYRPQKLVAAFFSAALLCTTGIALADKDGHHNKHGSAQGGPAAPGEKNPGADSKAAAERGPGGIGGPRSAPGDFDRTMGRNGLMGEGARGSEFEGRAGDGDTFGAGAKAGVHVKLANGGMHDFDISGAALNSLKTHQGRDDLIFFTNGSQQITAVCNRGEKDNMRVTARTGDTFTLQDQSGQTRMITLDSKTASRLHVKVGSDLQVTAMSATSGSVVALDLVKKHDFDKFARGSKSDVDVAKLDADRQKVDSDTRKVDSDRVKGRKSDVDVDVAKLDMDRRAVDVDQQKLDMDKARGNKTDIDADQRKLEADKKKCDRDIAQIDVDTKGHKAKKSDVEVAKADVDTEKTKKHGDHEVGSSCGGTNEVGQHGGNHEHSDKSGRSCAGPHPSDAHGGIATTTVPVNIGQTPVNGGTTPVNGGTTPVNGGTSPVNGGTTPVRVVTPARPPNGPGSRDRGPGAPVGMVPVAGGSFPGSGTRGSTRGSTRGGSPTHVLGAATGPTVGRTRHIAALPTRVLPVAIQPVGKRRCVWYKTGVLGASTGPYRIIGTSAVRGRTLLHKKCR